MDTLNMMKVIRRELSSTGEDITISFGEDREESTLRFREFASLVKRIGELARPIIHLTEKLQEKSTVQQNDGKEIPNPDPSFKHKQYKKYYVGEKEMNSSIARHLFDLQQKVVEQCLEIADNTSDENMKRELVDAAEKAVEVEKLFLIHIPRD